MKQQRKKTRYDKKAEHGTVPNYYESKRHKKAVQLNQEINEVASSILKNTKDLDLEFSKTGDENFWGLV